MTTYSPEISISAPTSKQVHLSVPIGNRINLAGEVRATASILEEYEKPRQREDLISLRPSEKNLDPNKDNRVELAVELGIIDKIGAKSLQDKPNSELDFLSVANRDKLLQKAEELGIIEDAKTHPLSNESDPKKIDAANKDLAILVRKVEQYNRDIENPEIIKIIPPDALANIKEIKNPIERAKALDHYRKVLEVRGSSNEYDIEKAKEALENQGGNITVDV